MASYQELRKIRNEKYRNNGYFSIFVFFVMGLLCTAYVFINLLLADLIIYVTPLLILPTMFAFQRVMVALREGEMLSFRLTISSFGRYFTSRYRSSYCFFNVLWKLVLIFLGTFVLAITVTSTTFYNLNYLSFREMIDQVNAIGNNFDEINTLLNSYQNTYRIYLMYIFLPPSILTSTFALYLYSLNAISIPLRLSNYKASGGYIKELVKIFKKYHRNSYVSSYFKLNWPLYILFAGGFALGGFVGHLYHYNYNSIFTFGLAFAIFFAFGIYGSVYFANKEALYQVFEQDIKNADKIIYQKRQEMMEEMRQRNEELERLMKEFERRKEEEENKNDSNES